MNQHLLKPYSEKAERDCLCVYVCVKAQDTLTGELMGGVYSHFKEETRPLPHILLTCGGKQRPPADPRLQYMKLMCLH